MEVMIGVVVGFVAWFVLRYLASGIYTVDQNELAVICSWGRAERIEGKTTLHDPVALLLREEERERYNFPQVRVVRPGGPYFKWPWQTVHKVSIATQTANMALDPEDPGANNNGTALDAVTMDQLNIRLKGQIRFKICERNLYAYLFGVKRPLVHVMAYFIAVLRERIANFENPVAAALTSAKAAATAAATATAAVALAAAGPAGSPVGGPAGGDLVPAAASGTGFGGILASPDVATAGISINDLRKNLHTINEHMFRECQVSAARSGITLDASLITAIDPPRQVEGALAAINTAHNEVSSDLSLAQAAADQRLVQSQKAVEIATLDAGTEVEPLRKLAEQLVELKRHGTGAIPTYLRNLRLALLSRAERVIREVQ